jgi:hypothetical protein
MTILHRAAAALFFAGLMSSTALARVAQNDCPANASNCAVTATGAITPRSLAARSGELTNVKDGYGAVAGAKGDGVLTDATVTTTASSATLTVGSALFTAADVGKVIVIGNAGVAATTGPVLTVPTSTAGSGYTSVPTCALTDAAVSGSGATCSALMKVISATVNGAGSGCTPGAAEFVVGITGTGTPAKITGTVDGGGTLSGALVVASAGQFTALAGPTAVAAYGASCATAPTVDLSYGVGAIWVTAQGTAYTTAQTTASLTGGSPSVAATLGTPVFGAPVPPHKTTIATYVSSTQVTMTDVAPISIAGVSKRVLIATNDGPAFQAALTAGSTIWVPPGIYWIGSELDPGKTTPKRILGAGRNASILMYDGGTSSTYNTGDWTPMFDNTSGSASAPAGTLEIQAVQFRGLLDFGRVNIGASVLQLNNFENVTISDTNWYQLPFMAMQMESHRAFALSNSTFDLVLRDQARCRSCFNVLITGNEFTRSNDDSVALHQASYINAQGTVREGIIVSDNIFEDTLGVSILGGRQVTVANNQFRRNKIGPVRVYKTSDEGINQIGNILVTGNTATDTIARAPFTTGGSYCLVEVTFVGATNVGGTLPGAPVKGTAYFAKPWDYNLTDVTLATQPVPPARGITVTDNTCSRTLPATDTYSGWGYGTMMTEYGLIDPPVADAAMRPISGIIMSVNTPGARIESNSINNVGRGIVINDARTSTSQAAPVIKNNTIYDAIVYGIVGFGSGALATPEIIGNRINVDPYGMSPGRSGGAGGWSYAYGEAKCLYWGYSTGLVLRDNIMENCYTTSISADWRMSGNIIRGTPFSSLTGQLNSWSSANLGVAVAPLLAGDAWWYEYVTAQPNVGTPESFGSQAVPRVTYASAAPASGWHAIGQIIWSTAPAGCSCMGWVALTTGSGWVAGTDYKVIPLT